MFSLEKATTMVYLTAFSSCLLLAGCSSNDTQSEPRTRVPNYASLVDSNRWEVSCGRNKVIIDGNSLNQFYKADGSALSYIEFCDKYANPRRTNINP